MAVELQLRSIIDNSNEVIESPILQSPAEDVTYSLDVTSYGIGPTNVSVTAINEASQADVSASVVTTPATVLGNLISWGISALIEPYQYRLAINFTISSTGQPLTRYLRINCRD